MTRILLGRPPIIISLSDPPRIFTGKKLTVSLWSTTLIPKFPFEVKEKNEADIRWAACGVSGITSSAVVPSASLFPSFEISSSTLNVRVLF